MDYTDTGAHWRRALQPGLKASRPRMSLPVMGAQLVENDPEARARTIGARVAEAEARREVVLSQLQAVRDHSPNLLVDRIVEEHGAYQEMMRREAEANEQRRQQRERELELEKEKEMAAAEGDTAKVQQLIEAGAEIAWEDEFGSTALHCACTNGHVLCARLLLTGRASVDQTNKNGATALHVACCDGHDNCAELLLAANAAWRARA